MGRINDSRPFTEVTDFVRFPLILGIILLHSDILSDVNTPDGMSLWSLDIVTLLSGVLTRSCVPLFYAMSGYLFFLNRKFSTGIYIQKLKRRVRSLLLPYLIWNLFGMFLYLLKRTPMLEARFPQYASIPLDLPNLLIGFWAIPGIPYPYDFVLWFIRDLMVAVVVAPPFIWFAARYLKIWGIAAATIVMAGGALPWALAETLFYFYLGAYAAISGTDCMRLTERLRFLPGLWTAMAVSLLFIPVESAYYEPFFFATRLCGMLSTLALAGMAVRRGWSIPRLLAGSTFFIYAFHGLMVSVVRKQILTWIDPTGNMGYLAAYLLTFATLTAVSLAAYLVCRTLLPRLTAVATGGRD